MILVKITLLPSSIQKEPVLKRAFKDLTVWVRNVKGKFVAERDEVLFSLRISGKRKALKLLQNKNDFSELALTEEECVLFKA